MNCHNLSDDIAEEIIKLENSKIQSLDFRG